MARKPHLTTEGPTKRFIMTLPATLHQRIKLSATSRQITMMEAIREALEHASWPVVGVERERKRVVS
jgi:hypothetical protein